MALIKCVDCGKEVSSNAESCPHCGCPVSLSMKAEETSSGPETNVEDGPSEKQELEKSDKGKPEKKKPNKKSLYVIIAVAAIIVIGGLIVFLATSKTRTYNSAVKYYDAGEYEEASPLLRKLGDYKDSEDMLEDCEYYTSVDGEFLVALANGLMARWDISETDEAEMSDTEFVKFRQKLVNLELEEVNSFEDKKFKDKELENLAKQYIDALNTQLKALDYYIGDYDKYDVLWEKGYDARSKVLKTLATDYTIPIEHKYKETLDEFVQNANAIEEKEDVEKAIARMLKNNPFKLTESEYGWKTYSTTLSNSTSETFEYCGFDIIFYNAAGTQIGTAYTNEAKSWKPNKKAQFEFQTEETFDHYDYKVNFNIDY